MRTIVLGALLLLTISLAAEDARLPSRVEQLTAVCGQAKTWPERANAIKSYMEDLNKLRREKEPSDVVLRQMSLLFTVGSLPSLVKAFEQTMRECKADGNPDPIAKAGLEESWRDLGRLVYTFARRGEIKLTPKRFEVVVLREPTSEDVFYAIRIVDLHPNTLKEADAAYKEIMKQMTNP